MGGDWDYILVGYMDGHTLDKRIARLGDVSSPGLLGIDVGGYITNGRLSRRFCHG
jgi:hypothetical protein